MTPPADDWFMRARLKLRHLQLFAALDEHRNIHRAAEALGMSQPAASKLLAELEHQLGVTLFERRSRGVEPNWYGEVMIRRSRSIIAELDNAGEELSALRAGHSGRVVVGTVAPGIQYLAQAIEHLQREHPALRVSIDTDVSQSLVESLAEGKYDLVLARIPDRLQHNRFVYENIADERLSFVCRRGHPLCNREGLTLSDLAAFAWVLEPPDGLLRQRVNAQFLTQGIALPRQIIETRSVLVSMALIGRTDAITALSTDVARLAFDPRRFHVIGFDGSLTLKPFGIVRQKGRRLSPGAMELIQMVRRIAAQAAAEAD